MWRRWLAGVLGAFNALNGVVMLADGRHWYDTVPGVVFTGPYNPHFVRDIGAAFLAAGLGLIARAWRVRYWPAAVVGAGFLALHAARIFGQQINRLVVSANKKTGLERLLLPSGGQFLRNPHEGGLRGVAGILPVGQDCAGKGKRRRRMAF